MSVDCIGPMRGWGRGLRKGVGNWCTKTPTKNAVYQAVSDRNRYNWTHRDLLGKAHPKPKAVDSRWHDLFTWTTKGTLTP